MADRLALANLALVWLGEETQDNLIPENLRNNTRKLLPFLDQARDEVLEQHGWRCALRWVELEAVANFDGNWEFANCFNLPGDCLRVWKVDRCDTASWTFATLTDGDGATRKVVLSNNAGPLKVAYSRRAAVEALPPSLVTAVALWAAAAACWPINGDDGKAAKLLDKAQLQVRKALGIDGMQAGNGDVLVQDELAILRGSAG